MRNLSLNRPSRHGDKVPNLAVAFIPTSGLARDREWRFWHDANVSERHEVAFRQ